MTRSIAKSPVLLFAILCAAFFYLFSCFVPAHAEESNSAGALRLPGLGVLGCGYDATGHYANVVSVRLPIFDLGAYDTMIVAPNGTVYSVPNKIKDRIALRDIARGMYYSFSDELAEKFRTKLNTKVKLSGSYGFFSGSVSSSFTQEELASFNHKFISVRHVFEGWVLALPDHSTLTMLESAKKDIEGALPPSEVIVRYGTHVLVSAVIGGRAEYTCFVDQSKYKSKLDIATAAEASYKSALNLDTSVKTKYKKEVEEFRQSATTKFMTIGGEFETETEFDPTSFTKWMISFKKHPVLVEFTDRSLVEIYKLASNEQRRKKLEAAYTAYIKNSEKLFPDNMPLLEVEIVSVHSVDFVANDSGSGAKMNLAVYKPKIPKGWYWLGHSGNLDDKLVRVKPLVPGAVTEPLSYKRAWGDWGSGKDHGYSLWNISPQPHYCALGGIARLRKGRTDWAEPKGKEVEGLACLHRSLCTKGMLGKAIWNDSGSKAKKDGKIWEIKPKNKEGINARTFYCVGSYAKPKKANVYVIKKGKRIKYTED